MIATEGNTHGKTTQHIAETSQYPGFMTLSDKEQNK
jgi:hypothetical protein